MADDSMDVSYSNKRTPLGVELPNDIWLSIIERLVSMSDLKALCLTSKSLRVLATPYLYDTVRIPLWNTPRVDAFFQSVGCGAGVHLGNTRTLIFEDEETPEEAICNLAGSFAFPNAPYFPVSNHGMPVTGAVKDHAMDTILQFFARSTQLTTYRFIGSRHQSDSTMSLLQGRHPNMENYQNTIKTCFYLWPWLRQRPRLRTFDLLCGSREPIVRLVKALESLNDTLESLSIGCALTIYPIEEFSIDMYNALKNPGHLANVKSLTLRHFDLSTMYDRLCNLVDVGQLSRLSLLSCKGSHCFLVDMAKVVDTKSLKLKHFALQDITQENTPVSTETLEKAMDFLNAILCSPILESLHLSWIFDRPSIVISFLHPSAPNLVSFSSHASVIGRTTEMNKHELADWELFEFEKLLNHCPKLQAFGFQLPELHLQPYHRGGRVQHITVDDRFMSALRRAPDLRILHLRQSNYILEDEPRPYEQFEDDKKAWAFQTQKWANAFFAYLHERGWCPKLNSLVIRCYMLNEHEGDAVITYIPQSCYIRGFQTDTFGRSGVVAVPVTRAILRATEPCAGILDYDPETNWAIGKFAPDDEMEWG